MDTLVPKPRVGVCLGNWLPLTVLQRAAKLAEERDFDSFWMAESSTGVGKDAPSQLAALAMTTSKIRFGTAAFPIFTRTPTLVAQVATSLDEISDGRFALGMSSAHGLTLLHHHGVTVRRTIQRLREYLIIVRGALDKGELSYKGEIFNIPHLKLLVPNPHRHIPIYLFLQAPETVEVAGELADGVIFNFQSPEYLEELINRLRQAASDAGRDPTKIDTAANIFACADDARAEEACSLQMAFALRLPFYQNHLKQGGFAKEVDRITRAIRQGSVEEGAKQVSDRMLDALALVGNPKHWPTRLQRYYQAGVSLTVPMFFQRGPEAYDFPLGGKTNPMFFQGGPEAYDSIFEGINALGG